jgi:NAD(P)-dependent dehydrogenase (short-subunit alcohol dehydrogenase family)
VGQEPSKIGEATLATLLTTPGGVKRPIGPVSKCGSKHRVAALHEHRRVAGHGRATVAAGPAGHPADVADVVAFLAGPDGRWVTGQNIRAGGGII